MGGGGRASREEYRIEKRFHSFFWVRPYCLYFTFYFFATFLVLCSKMYPRAMGTWAVLPLCTARRHPLAHTKKRTPSLLGWLGGAPSRHDGTGGHRGIVGCAARANTVVAGEQPQCHDLVKPRGGGGNVYYNSMAVVLPSPKRAHCVHAFQAPPNIHHP